MGQNELNVRFTAGIGKPVTVEGTFTNNRQAQAAWINKRKEEIEIVAAHIFVHDHIPGSVHDATYIWFA